MELRNKLTDEVIDLGITWSSVYVILVIIIVAGFTWWLFKPKKKIPTSQDWYGEIETKQEECVDDVTDIELRKDFIEAYLWAFNNATYTKDYTNVVGSYFASGSLLGKHNISDFDAKCVTTIATYSFANPNIELQKLLNSIAHKNVEVYIDESNKIVVDDLETFMLLYIQAVEIAKLTNQNDLLFKKYST